MGDGGWEMVRTRKLSPTIQAGASPPVDTSKKAPRQVLSSSCSAWKSALLIGQD